MSVAGDTTGGTGLRVALPSERYFEELISCQSACPVHTDARGYVRAIAAGRFEEAYLIARGPNPFASICGRVCAAPCEAACRRGRLPVTDGDGRWLVHDRPIGIRALKRFACERAGFEGRPPEQVWTDLRDFVPPTVGREEELAALLRAEVSGAPCVAHKHRVAIIGSGPAGLSAAHDLALLGIDAVVFESESVPGGMLALGIPEFRLPRNIIAHEMEVIKALGVEIRCGTEVGRDIDFAKLRAEFNAVIISVGAKRARLLGLPGERGPRVLGGVDFLRAIALAQKPDLGENVVVIGGGNVAYDVARSVMRQVALDTARAAVRVAAGTRVRLVSLETLEEMPADTAEIKEGDAEGIERIGGFGPVEIRRDETGRVVGLVVKRCTRVFDEEGRFRPTFDETDVRELACDTVLLATGQSIDLGFLEQGGQDIARTKSGWPEVDAATLATTAAGVFVAGDLAHGTRLIIDAVASGKRAARSVFTHLTGEKLTADAVTAHVPLENFSRESDYEGIRRTEVPMLGHANRLEDAKRVVELGYDDTQARREASRCLDCGVTPIFDGDRCVLCGGCADVCPTSCLKLVALDDLSLPPDVAAAVHARWGADVDLRDHSAVVKDEERCIRCGLCAARCLVSAITMERFTCETAWRRA